MWLFPLFKFNFASRENIKFSVYYKTLSIKRHELLPNFNIFLINQNNICLKIVQTSTIFNNTHANLQKH